MISRYIYLQLSVNQTTIYKSVKVVIRSNMATLLNTCNMYVCNMLMCVNCVIEYIIRSTNYYYQSIYYVSSAKLSSAIQFNGL